MGHHPAAIDSDDDMIDSRDVIVRMDDLMEIDDPATEDIEELTNLIELTKQAESLTSEWEDGAQLIRDSYFPIYAEELVNDIGVLPKDLPAYISAHIDWEAVSRELQEDYSSFDWQGETYWVRSC